METLMIQRAFGTYLTATVLVATSLVSSGLAHAQEEAEPEAPAGDEPAAEPAEPTPAPEADTEAQAAAKAEADADVGVKLDTSGSTEADVAAEAEADATKAKPANPRRYGKADEWKVEPYGHVRADFIRDSTESFFDGTNPYLIGRPGTYKGQHPRITFTARDTRVGLDLAAPDFEGIKTTGKIEFDFFGIPPTDVKENDQISFGPVRVRHAYVKLHTAIDIIAGQYYDLLGWGPNFYPATVAFLGVPAQVYHRNPQLRLEKAIDLGGLELTAAVAAVRPGQRDSGVPDAQAGLKLAIGGWTGAAMQGLSQPNVVPLSLGVSGLYRHFKLPAFRPDPGALSQEDTGYGFVVNAVLPVIPAKKVEDRGNALTLTGEFSKGSGIADMYTGMEGGSRLPLLPDPTQATPALIYPQNIDPGMVTFDREWELRSINWQGFVAGLQYYLPIDNGRLWISGIYSQIKSDNIKELTPYVSWGAIFTKMEYMDASLGFAITPAVILGVSAQTLKQTFADVSADTPIYGTIAVNGTPGQLSIPGTGGKAASARNNRGQITMMFFF
jgi:hypothetical protein